MTGVALGDIHLRFTWQAWQLRHWAGSGGAPGSQLTPWTSWLFAWQAWHLRGLWWRTGFSADAVDAAPLCVAGVALGDMRGTWRFTWQAWRLRHWAGSGGAPGSQLTPWTPRLFAWQAWPSSSRRGCCS